jgi:hypothetical protein
VRKVVFFIGFISLSVPAVAVIACSSDTPNDGRIDLPPRQDTGQRPQPEGDSAPAESCTNLTLKVGEPAACDNCAKTKCCSEVLACSKSSDCTALQECIAPCAQTDFLCITACQASHPEGDSELGAVGRCARSKCKVECPSETPDADIFGDGGL